MERKIYMNTKENHITNHGKERLKERNGWNEKTSARMILKVLENGEDLAEKTGYLGNWAREKLKTERRGHRYILYGTQVYVFARDILITVYPAPSKSRALTKTSKGQIVDVHRKCKFAA